jgi:hypothetical protein
LAMSSMHWSRTSRLSKKVKGGDVTIFSVTGMQEPQNVLAFFLCGESLGSRGMAFHGPSVDSEGSPGYRRWKSQLSSEPEDMACMLAMDASSCDS